MLDLYIIWLIESNIYLFVTLIKFIILGLIFWLEFGFKSNYLVPLLIDIGGHILIYVINELFSMKYIINANVRINYLVLVKEKLKTVKINTNKVFVDYSSIITDNQINNAKIRVKFFYIMPFELTIDNYILTRLRLYSSYFVLSFGLMFLTGLMYNFIYSAINFVFSVYISYYYTRVLIYHFIPNMSLDPNFPTPDVDFFISTIYPEILYSDFDSNIITHIKYKNIILKMIFDNGYYVYSEN